MKRINGKLIVDEEVEHSKNYWGFELISDKDHHPAVEITYNKEKKLIYPENVSGLILQELKKAAEDFTGKHITKALITVPAYFNNSQKQATIKAAQQANLEVVGLISEPAAAAIAYGYDDNKFSDYTIFVFDLGGGTFDAVVVKVKNGNFNIKAIGGDTHLGGRNFDNLLMDHFASLIKTKYGLDCLQDKKVRQNLLKECIEIKESLSDTKKAT